MNDQENLPTQAADQIAFLLQNIARKQADTMKETARRAGLSVRELTYLMAIENASRRGEVTATMVAKAANLSSSTATRIADQLAASGYIVRRHGEEDRRNVFVSLTAAGRQRLEALPQLLHDGFLCGLNSLPSEDRTTLLRALTRVLEAMDRNGTCEEVN